MTDTKNNRNREAARTQAQAQALTRRQVVQLLLLSSLPASASGVVGLCGVCCYGADYSRHDGYAADQGMSDGGAAVADRAGDG